MLVRRFTHEAFGGAIHNDGLLVDASWHGHACGPWIYSSMGHGENEVHV